MAESSNVWSQSSDNTYQNVYTSDNTNSSTSVERTRIYMYSDKTITLDEMSLSLQGDVDADARINPSTGQHNDSSNNIDGIGQHSTGNLSGDHTMAIGTSYPLLRINDHYYTVSDIKKFVLETSDVIPTIEVYLSLSNNDILKGNQIKDGDICSVFINPGHGMLKSYRADFIITSAMLLEQRQTIRNLVTDIIIRGELYVPNLYNATQPFYVIGTSRDAMIDLSQRLGLGFFFCDPENTNDLQTWYCQNEGDQAIGADPPYLKYLKNISAHAWKNFESFFDCWIDPRYGISFININKMLGYEGLDEPVDIAFFNKALTQGRGVDGQNADDSDEKKKANPRPQAKIFSNIGSDVESTTAFFVKSFREINNGGDISKQLGLSMSNYYDIKNSGIDAADANVQLKMSVPYNKTKCENGFYILAGPGTNGTYKQADNGSYVDQHTSVQGGKIADTQSDTDAQNLETQGNNMMSSGNTNKFFETAEGHNLFNNKWLEKKMIEVKLNGCNLQIMRGEKIPMILQDNQGGFNMVNLDSNNFVNKRLFETGCGWFIIKAIKWTYNADIKDGIGTRWETQVLLTRREWPIIGYNKNNVTEKQIVAENNAATGSTKESQSGSSSETNETSSSSSTSGTTQADEVNANGLASFMLTIYNDIKSAVSANNGSIKLISGKRWPADENGNKIDGTPYKDGNLYKFINANGDTVWYASNTSRHIYGEAIDIINDSGTTFQDVINAIIGDFQTLYDMFTNGVYCGVETTKDDTGNSVKHYHIGTVDKSNNDSIKGQQTWWQQLIALKGNNILKGSNGKYINMSSYAGY